MPEINNSYGRRLVLAHGFGVHGHLALLPWAYGKAELSREGVHSRAFHGSGKKTGRGQDADISFKGTTPVTSLLPAMS